MCAGMMLRVLAWETESIRHREQEAALSGMHSQGCRARMGLPSRAQCSLVSVHMHTSADESQPMYGGQKTT